MKTTTCFSNTLLEVNPTKAIDYEEFIISQNSQSQKKRKWLITIACISCFYDRLYLVQIVLFFFIYFISTHSFFF